LSSTNIAQFVIWNSLSGPNIASSVTFVLVRMIIIARGLAIVLAKETDFGSIGS